MKARVAITNLAAILVLVDEERYDEALESLEFLSSGVGNVRMEEAHKQEFLSYLNTLRSEIERVASSPATPTTKFYKTVVKAQGVVNRHMH